MVHIRLRGELNMSQAIEMKRLKEIGIETTNSNVVQYVIMNLSAYGYKSIPVISEIMKNQPDRVVRMYGMQTITRIKQGSF
jgi:hypothetical protein